MAVLRSILSHGFGERYVTGLQIQLGFGRRSEDFRTLIVELTFPSGDDNGGETVADEVYAGAAHVHQFVDARAITNRQA